MKKIDWTYDWEDEDDCVIKVICNESIRIETI